MLKHHSYHYLVGLIIKFIVITLVLFFACSFSAYAKLNVLFVNPSKQQEPFWFSVESAARDSAKALGIDLSVIYGEGNRYSQLQNLQYHLAYHPTPDYVVLMKYPGGAMQVMALLEEMKVPFVTLERTVLEKEKAQIGEPQEIFKYWLGELYHDNEDAGEQLAAKLIEQAKRVSNKPINVIGINGHYGAESQTRSRGLLKLLKKENATLNQLVYAQWSEQMAYQQTLSLMKRYPNTNVIWCASDLMALGAARAVQSMGMVVNRDVVIGGFDWLDKAIYAIKNERLSASVGGHHMMAAWALEVIAKHAKGYDSFSSQKDRAIQFQLALIDAQTVEKERDLELLKRRNEYALSHQQKGN